MGTQKRPRLRRSLSAGAEFRPEAYGLLGSSSLVSSMMPQINRAPPIATRIHPVVVSDSLSSVAAGARETGEGAAWAATGAMVSPSAETAVIAPRSMFHSPHIAVANKPCL